MTIPKKAMVLAAGHGKRMRPLTDTCPKPLLKVAGSSMLDRALDALAAVGVEEAVVNAHHLPEMIEEAVKGRAAPRITISREDELLETGGGTKYALDFFGDDPFFVLNADIVWTDGEIPALQRMAEAWDDATMDVLLLMKPASEVPGWKRHADYYLAPGSDRPVFHGTPEHPADHLYTGLRIAHPRAFAGVEEKCFSFVEIFHKAEAKGRLAALNHEGEWYHVGDPEALAETDRILTASQGPSKKCAV